MQICKSPKRNRLEYLEKLMKCNNWRFFLAPRRLAELLTVPGISARRRIALEITCSLAGNRGLVCPKGESSPMSATAERCIAQFCSQGLRDPSENLPWYLKQQQTSLEMLVRLALIHQKGFSWTDYKEQEHFANKLILEHAKHASVWKLGAPNSVTTKFRPDSKRHLLQKDHNWP